MALEVACVLQRRGDDAGGQSERRVVGHRQRRFVVLDANHRRDRTEDLLAVDAHLGRAVREERGRHVIALGIALQTFTAVRQPRAFRAADAHVLEVLLELPLVDDRTDLRPRLQRIVNHQPLHAIDDRLDEPIVNAFGDDQAARCGAALTGLKKRAVDRDRYRGRQIGIVEHDERVFAAHLELHPRPGLHCGLGNRWTDVLRAGKTDRIHLR